MVPRWRHSAEGDGTIRTAIKKSWPGRARPWRVRRLRRRLLSEPTPSGLFRERIGPHLELHDLRPLTLATFVMERRAVAGRRPDAAALPAGVRVIDAAVHGFGIEAHRVRHHEVDHLAVLERDDRLVLVAGGERHVRAQPKRVVLVDPGIVARFRRAGAVITSELGARERIERPALGAMLAVADGRCVE